MFEDDLDLPPTMREKTPISPPLRYETEVPLVQPLYGPKRYVPGSITVTHTTGTVGSSYAQLRQCSEEALHVRSKSETRVEKVVYAPYALYKCGNAYHYRSVGYSPHGEIVLYKDEISGSSDVEVRSRARSVSPPPMTPPDVVIVSDALNLENGQKYPGVKVVRGRKARQRTRNSHLLARAAMTENSEGADALMHPVDDDATRRVSSFHTEDGQVHDRWRAFTSITEEEQERLLQSFDRRTASESMNGSAGLAVNPNHGSSRFNKLSKQHKALLRTSCDNDVLWEALTDMERALRQWINDEGKSADKCVDEDSGEDLNVSAFTVELDDPCHRKLLHCMSEYYNMRSWSHTLGGSRVTSVTTCKGAKRFPDLPLCGLCDFLKSPDSPYYAPVTCASHGGRKKHPDRRKPQPHKKQNRTLFSCD